MRTLRTLCASTLICEFFVIGFAGLVAMKLSDLSMGTVWTVSGIAMVLCILLSGLLSRPWALQVGWALQIGLVLSGFVVPVMFILGLAFTGLWWASIHYGRHIDQAKARFAAMDERARELAEAEVAAGEPATDAASQAKAQAGAAAEPPQQRSAPADPEPASASADTAAGGGRATADPA